MVPVEEGALGIPVTPERCRRCQQPWPGEETHPQRHQVTALPPVEPGVTAYQLHQLGCPACGEVTRAEVPPGGPTGGFGPRVQARAALGTGASHRSKRTTQRVLAERFGVSLGLGTVANLEQATAQAVAAPVAEARAYVQAQPAAYADETGWREGQPRAWLWTVVTAGVTVFAGQPCEVPKTAGTCREILRRRQALWTFVRHPEGEPTNKAAERAIRPGVLWRTGSLGTQSAEDSRFVAAMMTVVATLKQQHRHGLEYVTAACEATLHGEAAPSLLPTPAALAQMLRPAA